jgi:predicted acyl esterase
MAVEFKDNSASVKSQINSNIVRALTAMGQAAVEITTGYMNTRYSKPIYLTGDLQRDLNFRTNESEQHVKIGNSLEYAPWVHNGTRRMVGKPYLKDAIMENRQALKEVAAEQIKSGF